MKTTMRICFLAIFVASPSSGYAISWGPLSIPELVQASDVIVVGKAESANGHSVLRVTRVLKGEMVEKIDLSSREIGFNDVVIPLEKAGIHFLRRRGMGYEPFHPACYKPTAELPAVTEILKMFADPGVYLNRKPIPENPDFVYVLGEAFSGWRVMSEEIPSLEKHMTRFADRYYEVAPWVNDQKVTLECETTPSGMLKITSAQPKGALADFFKSRLLTASLWPDLREDLKPSFRVTLDARTPQRVGSASQAAALSYLRDQLTSKNPDVVSAALLALAKLRNREAVPLVVALIKDEDRKTQIQAINFLGWSRSMGGEKSLRELLDSKAPLYPKDHDLSDAAAVSLRRIGGSKSIPCLERAACCGVQRAIEAIGAMGRTESFQILLDAAEQDPRRCAYAVNAFYWLVRRSNKPVEPWMSNATWNEKIGMEKIPKWLAWWESNSKAFRVIKSQQEAIDDTMKENP